ncbi:MAG: PIN domain-containing protein [Bacteroidales bacterium]|nr:PIN domain-containing protein [Bacteroidales bacterium]
MKIFLDTNVLLDTMLPDRSHQEDTYTLMNLSLIHRWDCRICVSILTLANTAYIARKVVGIEEVKKRLKTILDAYHISPMGDQCLHLALHSKSPDFEDALQIAAAENDACDVFITHDKKHFTGYTCLPVYTPEEFLARCRRS